MEHESELRQLLAKVDTENPAPEDREALHAHLVKHGMTELAAVGNLAGHATSALIKTTHGHNYGFSVAVAARVRELRVELGHNSGSPLEKLLIENIVLCWLRVHDVELRIEAIRRAGSVTFEQGDYWERKLTLVQHRYIKVIEALARVRRLQKEPPSPALAILMKQQIGIVSK